MDIVYKIMLETILGLALVTLSFIAMFSAMVLFRPLWARALSDSLNKSFATDPTKAMDISFSTTEKIIAYRFVFGPFLVFGSVFVLWYLTQAFNSGQFITYLVGAVNPKTYLLLGMGVEIIQWLTVFGALLGLIMGITLLTRPDSLVKVTQKMDQSFSIQPDTVGRSDRSHSGLDDWVWKHHLPVGTVLSLGSVLLLIVYVRMYFK